MEKMQSELKAYAKSLLVLAAVATASLLFTTGYALAQDDTYNNVILISWDGAQLNHVHELYEAGKLPTVKMLRESGGENTLYYNGSASLLYIMDHLTDTDAGHAQMLTGYGPGVTTVYHNSFNSIPDGLTIWERLPPKYTTALISSRECAQDYPDEGHGFVSITFSNASEDIDYWWDSSELNWGDEGILYEDIQHNMTDYVSQVTAETTVNNVINWIDKNQRKKIFLFIHFGEPDAIGHIFGENHEEYTEGLIADDNATGKIVQKLKDLGIYDKTSIIVTTDHGFEEGGYGHGSLPYPWEYTKYADYADPDCYKIWMVSNTIKGDRVGFQNDVAPTIYGLFGIDYTKFEPSFNGSVLGRFDAKPIWKRNTNPCWNPFPGSDSTITATLTKHDAKTKLEKKTGDVKVEIEICFTIDAGSSDTIALKEVTDDEMGGTWSIDPKNPDVEVEINGKKYQWPLVLDEYGDIWVDFGDNGVTLSEGDEVEVEMDLLNTVTDHILLAELYEDGSLIYYSR